MAFERSWKYFSISNSNWREKCKKEGTWNQRKFRMRDIKIRILDGLE